MTVKREARRGRERAFKMASGPNIDSKFRDSHITGKYPSFEDGAMKANTLMSPRHTGEERRVSQCRGHMYRWICYYGSIKMRSIVIIIELSYLIFIAIILIYRIVYRSKTVS